MQLGCNLHDVLIFMSIRPPSAKWMRLVVFVQLGMHFNDTSNVTKMETWKAVTCDLNITKLCSDKKNL